MSFWNIATSALLFLFNFLMSWIHIVISPFQQLEMLWIIIPIYINWIFTDFFQERKGTSLGNAITNGAVLLWVSIDWTRRVVNSFQGFSWVGVLNLTIITLVLGYGLMIMIEGIRGNDLVTRIGRVREVSYVMLMFTPVIYGKITLTLTAFLSMIIFFFPFYYLMEIVDEKILPKLGITKIEKIDEELEKEWDIKESIAKQEK